MITGASGNLGRAVTEALGGHDVSLSDLAPFQTDLPYERADARSLDDMRRVVRPGYDLLVHTPAWHGIHSGLHPTPDYWQLNVDGTFNALTAAQEAGIKKVVWASSAVFYGPIRDKYSFSKQVGEMVLDHFREANGVKSVRLRYSNFTPYRDFIDYGLRLLGGGGLDRRDAGGATARAAEALLNDEAGDDWFDVTQDAAFGEDQAEMWASDPWPVLEGAFPEDVALLHRYLDGRLPPRLGTEHPEKLKSRLGYRPRYNFASFVVELRERHQSGDLTAPAGYSFHQE